MKALFEIILSCCFFAMVIYAWWQIVKYFVGVIFGKDVNDD